MAASTIFELGCSGVDRRVAQELLDVLTCKGYCYVRTPSISLGPRAGRHDIRQRARWLFHHHGLLTPSQQEVLKSPFGFRGYYRYVGASGSKDEIECFSVGKDVENPLSLREPYFRRRGWSAEDYTPMLARSNSWPDATMMAEAVDFRRDVNGFYEECHELSMACLRHLAVGLGIPDAECFTKLHSNRDNNLELKYYPDPSKLSEFLEVKSPKKSKILRRTSEGIRMLSGSSQARNVDQPNFYPPSTQERLASHEDLSSVTLLAQDKLGGLEVLNQLTDEYEAVPVLEDALLLNGGIFLDKWTSGAIQATPHRVRFRSDAGDRCSVVYFTFPNFDGFIEPFPCDGSSGPSFFAGDLMPTP